MLHDVDNKQPKCHFVNRFSVRWQETVGALRDANTTIGSKV
jgi:hypothetical protein